jgi:predicted NAD/FAD-dependent oxidoreductase
MNARDSRIAVVGAGVTGLVCARELVSRGARVQVFDKGRSPGGRIATRRGEPGCSFDHGAQYFTARDPGFGRAIADWLDRGVVAEWPGRLVSLEGDTARATSPQPRYVGVPGMSAMAADLAAGLAVRAGTRITSATRGPAGWTLTDEARGTFGPYDALVVTLPAPQAAGLLGSHPFAAEAAAIRMSPCWAVMVAFESRLEVPWDGAFVHASALSWVARNSSKPGRDPAVDCWVLHGASDWSAANLEAAPEVAARDLMEAFAVAVGASLPARRQVVAHRWRYSQGADPADRRVLFDPEARLAVCGDWLAGGRVEGAFLAGVRAAEVVTALG